MIDNSGFLASGMAPWWCRHLIALDLFDMTVSFP